MLPLVGQSCGRLRAKNVPEKHLRTLAQPPGRLALKKRQAAAAGHALLSKCRLAPGIASEIEPGGNFPPRSRDSSGFMRQTRHVRALARLLASRARKHKGESGGERGQHKRSGLKQPGRTRRQPIKGCKRPGGKVMKHHNGRAVRAGSE